jgi:hypothetical protein
VHTIKGGTRPMEFRIAALEPGQSYAVCRTGPLGAEALVIDRQLADRYPPGDVILLNALLSRLPDNTAPRDPHNELPGTT